MNEALTSTPGSPVARHESPRDGSAEGRKHAEVLPEAVSPAARPRIAWADSARALAIILVVVYHATGWIGDAGYDFSVADEYTSPLRSLRMPLFFTVAGLFAAKWVAASWRTLLRGKIIYFAWVFVLWEPISLAVRQATGHHQIPDAEWWIFVVQVAVAPVYPWSELWFIWVLGVLFLLARLIRPVPVWLQLGVALGISAWALSGVDLGGIAYRGAARYLLFFLIGLHLRPLVEAYAQRLRWWSGTLVVGGWYGLAWLVAGQGLTHAFGPYLLVNIAGLLAGIAICCGLAVVVPRLGRIGARTLPVFVLHTPLIHTILWLLAMTGIVVPHPFSQWLPVVVAAVVIPLALVIDLVTRRSRLGWLWRPPDRLLKAVPSGPRNADTAAQPSAVGS
ncbi:acyltransferase family protein [Myceligenerans crystallogenes]|uniref:acyltransferase family protein n=1 Tax=Myceligenerans crystallogenes TaxID=316335 RepID=UPI0031DBABA6